MVVRAVVCSVVVHAAVVACLAGLVSPPARTVARATTMSTALVLADAPVAAPEADELARAPAEEPTAIELRTAGDAVVDVTRPGAPTAAPNPDPHAGAAARSSGHGGGAPTLVTARADPATLRVQPYDAPSGYQIQRIRTGEARLSREQVRATPHPDRTPWLASRPGAGHGHDARDLRPAPPSVEPRPFDRLESDRALGGKAVKSVAGFARPDVQANPAATDAAEPSERVADRVDQSLVSDEKQPAKLELSRPTSPGRETSGRGDGALGYAPAASGTAPVPTGAPGLPAARTLALATFQRVYDQYLTRVKQKVDPLWEFPRELAIRMEQGDVLVGFTIRKDGSVKDIRVLKASGFPSFDKNVLIAIRKAAPFDPLPETLGSELRVTAPFEGSNPAIR